jgi:hypothetical protein
MTYPVEEFDKLMSALVDGPLADEQRAAWERMMRDDTSARAAYIEFISAHVMLEWEFAGPPATMIEVGQIPNGHATGDEDKPALHVRLADVPRRALRALRRPTPLSIGVSTIVTPLLVLGLLWLFSPGRFGFDRPERTAPSAPRIVAQITDAHDARWSAASNAPHGRAFLVAGRKLDLAAGAIEVTFATGAQVILTGPAVFRIESPAAGMLENGKLVARVPSRAAGFAVATDAATIVDLGTEFGVASTDEAPVEVVVFEGKVALQPAAGKQARTLSAGEAARIDAQGRIEVRGDTGTGNFTRRLPLRPKSGPRRDIVGELIVADPVENDGTWELISTAQFVDANFAPGLLEPAVSVEERVLAMAGGADEGATKVFSSAKLAPGTYVAAFEMGNYSNARFPPGMKAELSLADGTSLADLQTLAITPVPAAGKWATWKLTYVVPAGDERIGQRLRFTVRDGGGQGNAALDALEIRHAPPPPPEL